MLSVNWAEIIYKKKIVHNFEKSTWLQENGYVCTAERTFLHYVQPLHICSDQLVINMDS
jgi:hypothetical protein